MSGCCKLQQEKKRKEIQCRLFIIKYHVDTVQKKPLFQGWYSARTVFRNCLLYLLYFLAGEKHCSSYQSGQCLKNNGVTKGRQTLLKRAWFALGERYCKKLDSFFGCSVFVPLTAGCWLRSCYEVSWLCTALLTCFPDEMGKIVSHVSCYFHHSF